MPIIDEKYQAPTWNNGASPAIDADELQDMCDTIEKSDEFSRKTPTLNGFVWNQAVGTLNLMENRCGGVYVENMLADAFNLEFGSKIDQFEQVYFGDGYMHIQGVLGMPRCGYNSAAEADLKPTLEKTGCHIFEATDRVSRPGYSEIIRFSPYNYYQTATFSVKLSSASGYWLEAQNVQLRDDDGNILWSGEVPKGYPDTATVNASALLNPNKVYHLYAEPTGDAEKCLLTQAYFTGTEVTYNNGTFQTIPLVNVYKKTKATLLLRGASLDSAHCEAEIDGEYVTLENVKTFQDEFYDGRNSAKKSCQCVRYECEVPENSENISAKVYMDSSSVEIYDYVLFLT